MDNLLANIRKQISVSTDLEMKVRSGFKVRELKRGELFIRVGQYAPKLAYVQSGILRCFSTRDGKESTNDFFFEDTFTTDFVSLTKNLPARQNFEALEQTVLYEISGEKLQKLEFLFPELGEWKTIVAGDLLHKSFNDQSESKLENPEQRYLQILRNKPEIIRRIPLVYIASYLGITPVHLSRIRKSVAQKTT